MVFFFEGLDIYFLFIPFHTEFMIGGKSDVPGKNRSYCIEGYGGPKNDKVF
jgi:hypothetical protein